MLVLLLTWQYVFSVATITWTEDDYRGSEGNQRVIGTVQTSGTLARDVSIRVTPLTYSQAMRIDNVVIPVNPPPEARSK